MKYSDLVLEFRNIMRDPSAYANKMFTDNQILTWAADANMEAIREGGLHQGNTSLSIGTGASEYSLPCSVMKITKIEGADKKRIYPTTEFFLDQLDDDWKTNTGTPEFYYEIKETGTRKIGIYKKPDAAQVLRVYYWCRPDELDLTDTLVASEEPELDRAIVKLIMPYIFAQGHQQKREFQERDKMLALFELNMKKMRKFWNRDQDGWVVMGSNEGVAPLRNYEIDQVRKDRSGNVI